MMVDMSIPPSVGRYRIDRVLGSGAFASVWLAQDDDLALPVAIKVLAGSLLDDLDVRNRFLEEARILRRADSDRLVRVHDIGELPDGRPYFVMSYADRGTLADRIRERPLRVLEALAFAEDTARSVGVVNALGVIHRDLKPSNVLFQSTPDGGERLLLADLGLARALAHSSGAFTLPVGTPGYMSPEQARFGGGLDVRADVYGLGALTYHLLTGRPPGPAPVKVPPSALRDKLPPAFDDVVLRALEVDREKRWSTAEDFAKALAWLRSIVPGGPPPGRQESVTVEDRIRPTGPQNPDIAYDAFPRPAEDDGELYVPLRASFRYVHEPLPKRDSGIPSLGSKRLTRELRERVLRSHGGTFLICGFRGIGKTTLVLHALEEIAQESPAGGTVLPVVLSVARPMTTERLLFSVVRRVFEALDEAGLLAQLAPDTQRSLLLAYRRTSLSVKETRSDAAERGAQVDLSLSPAVQQLAGLAGLAAPKSTLSAKQTRSLATETAFLNYCEDDVEYDMMRIVRMLSEGVPASAGRWWARLLRRRRALPVRVHLIIVLDEVDKLAAVPSGLGDIERLLTGMKNVLTMRGVHYIVVAGPEMHDQVLKDSAHGTGIYESIFAWRLYVPCNWRAPAKLVENVLDGPPTPATVTRLRDFDLYLRFKARGVPRRLLNEFNSFVVWRDGLPILRIRPTDDQRIAFYARLQQILEEFFSEDGRDAFPIDIDRDRWRLACYYVVDWVLRSEGSPFTSSEIITFAEQERVDPLLHASQVDVDALLDHLASRQMIEVARGVGVSSTLTADFSETQLPSYRLGEVARRRLRELARASETERAELDFPTRPQPLTGRDGVPHDVISDRYEVRRLIGEGGTSSVYEAYDTMLRRPVAIKILRRGLLSNAGATNRFVREARLTEGLRHPHLVNTYGLLAQNEELAIVMELVEGEQLSRRLRRLGRFSGPETARIGATLADVLTHLEAAGLVRIDIKPHNIVMHPDRGAVVIDLGLAKHTATAANSWHTQPGVFVGTPAYMAPEQIRGEPVDIKADVFGLGMVLLTCLNGENPYERMPAHQAMSQIIEKDIDVSTLPASPNLQAVVAQALERRTLLRFQHPSDLYEAIRATPEFNAEP